MNFFFPYTNPIVLTPINSYQPCQDDRLHEFVPCFQQQFAETDRLSFQVSWTNHNPITDGTQTLVIYILKNGVEYLFKSFSFLTHLSLGSYPSHFIKQSKVNVSNYCGVFCFSHLISEITDGYKNTEYDALTTYHINDNVSYNGENYICFVQNVGHLPTDTNYWQYLGAVNLISEGDVFKIRLRLNTNIIDSNELIYRDETYKTKLIHYYNTSIDNSVTHNTFFYYMPMGYDIRLPAEFLHSTQKADKEVFQGYDGYFNLVSALPYQVENIVIGGYSGLPDELVRNINFILHCDNKTIDGIPYELTADSELEVNYFDAYNNRILNVELCRKNLDTQEYNPATPSASGYTQYDTVEKTTGKLTVVTDANYYLSSDSNGILGYTFSEIVANGTKTITFSTNKNLTAETIYTTINIVNLTTNVIISTLILELPPTTKGIGYWTIGEFYVSKNRGDEDMAIINKELLKALYESGDTPSNADFVTFINSCAGILTDPINLPTASATTLGTMYIIDNALYTCILTDGFYSWDPRQIFEGITSYNDLTDKPTIEGVTISGAKTASQLNLITADGNYTALTSLLLTDKIYVVRAGVVYVTTLDLLKSEIESDVTPIIFTGIDVTGTGTGISVVVEGSKFGDIYINTSTSYIYQASAADIWDYKFSQKECIMTATTEGITLTTSDYCIIEISGIWYKKLWSEIITDLNLQTA